MDDYDEPFGLTLFTFLAAGIIAILLTIALLLGSNEHSTKQSSSSIERRNTDDGDTIRAYRTIESFQRTSGMK